MYYNYLFDVETHTIVHAHAHTRHIAHVPHAHAIHAARVAHTHTPPLPTPSPPTHAASIHMCPPQLPLHPTLPTRPTQSRHRPPAPAPGAPTHGPRGCRPHSHCKHPHPPRSCPLVQYQDHTHPCAVRVIAHTTRAYAVRAQYRSVPTRPPARKGTANTLSPLSSPLSGPFLAIKETTNTK